MQFVKAILFTTTALVSLVTAATDSTGNSVQFVNQDSTTRTIHFTPNAGLDAIEDLVVPGSETVSQSFPDSWIGNWYSVSEGAADVPGMLGEVSFNGFAGATFFDVSAIVNPNDDSGVKMIFPANSNIPVSGCQNFPCSNAYNKPDDIATLSSADGQLICLLGNLSNSRKRGMVAKLSREFVTA